MEKRIEVFEGDTLRMDIPFIRPENGPSCFLSGYDSNGQLARLPLSEELLSHHLMIMGGIGTGKTNVFNQLIQQIGNNQTDKDVMIIFDTKGDYYKRFYRPGIDIVISNDQTATGPHGPDFWNLFNELDQDDRLSETIIEITKTIFAERIKKSSQIFFPNAAKDLLGAIILYFLKFTSHPSNQVLNMAILEELSQQLLLNILDRLPEMASMKSYIEGQQGPQQMGVMAELQAVSREILLGNFGKTGSLSMRQIVREKGGRRVFIEYDLGIGQALTPVYRLLFDVAIKEALSRKKSEGNVWLFVDEFRLLPQLMHVGDAVNFGRSLGVKFVIGIQNIEQVYEAYGESNARSLMSGFMSRIIFKLGDPVSRKYVIDLFGKNRKMETYMSHIHQRGLSETVRDANVIEDWNINNLYRGEAIVSLPDHEPFLFKMEKFLDEEGGL